MLTKENVLSSKHEQGFAAMQAIGEYKDSNCASSLKNRDYKDATDLVIASFNPQMKTESQCYKEDNVSNTLINGTNPGFQNGICYGKQNKNVVRRLTPLECSRLQGYPDGWYDLGDWTDSNGKIHKESDSVKYKAAGNSIALPFWKWLAERICAEYDRPVTMASLFDGIGGFPLVFSQCGATPVWASEIEEFPIAVTKKRFPEKEDE